LVKVAVSESGPCSGQSQQKTSTSQPVVVVLSMPTNTGRLRSQSIMVFIVLDNAFDILANPYGTIIADYGDDYVDLFKKTHNNVKEEPAD
ncbi:hypothetical protein AB0I53_22205, partial [Saccharopolyspora sp. NPDC050389]|uniref:hypothetical protein n=1 Tax=Saccharopolyspora sp. NPDC050389 TaxID=3155516 RepID=UPI0033E6FE13